MPTIRFLMDRDMNHDVTTALKNSEPLIDILCVGDSDGPDVRTKDPELLEIAWQTELAREGESPDEGFASVLAA